jgi:hypothetical protein
MQQICHHASTSARSPSWPPMPRPRLQRAATARREKVQLRIREQSFPTVAGYRLVGCSVVSGRPLRSRAVSGVMMMPFNCSYRNKNEVTARLCRPGARSGLPCPVPACCCRARLARAGSGSHSGVELWRSRTGKGSSGGRKKGVV